MRIETESALAGMCMETEGLRMDGGSAGGCMHACIHSSQAICSDIESSDRDER